jgi:hypothetical protein
MAGSKDIALLDFSAWTLVIIDGGSAGDHTVTGIAPGDQIVEVVNGTDDVVLTGEFTVTAANTINNTGGTATTGDKLYVRYVDKT